MAGRRRRWTIEPYLGFGTRSKFVISGRVLENKGIVESTKLDSKWRNLRNTFRRFATAEIGGARVLARFHAAQAQGTTDREGYYTIELGVADQPVGAGWCPVELELQSTPIEAEENATATANVLVPPPRARFGIISDIDDTVVATNVTSTLRMLATVLFSNAHARMPFQGIAAFYQALHRGATGNEGNPVFYVSNGPWNFYGLLLELFKLNRIPLGPIFLRDFGPHVLFSRKSAHGGHKLLHIVRILDTYEALPFILIGDSGERDPEIYAEIVRRYPSRICAIYIRSVDPRPERLAAIAALAGDVRRTTTQFVLATDSAFAAVHAAGEGFIATSALAAIGADERL